MPAQTTGQQDARRGLLAWPQLCDLEHSSRPHPKLKGSNFSVPKKPHQGPMSQVGIPRPTGCSRTALREVRLRAVPDPGRVTCSLANGLERPLGSKATTLRPGPAPCRGPAPPPPRSLSGGGAGGTQGCQCRPPPRPWLAQKTRRGQRLLPCQGPRAPSDSGALLSGERAHRPTVDTLGPGRPPSRP